MADNGSQQSGGSGNKCQQVQDGQPSARSKMPPSSETGDLGEKWLQKFC
ncbi:hypothetical protein L798_04501 [Zootermopsis nevadensis]|uniref:Uncharacterized protein n=1 Tax=Zootermopsis nevadensis TaxID=136037 RepID=A0A067RD71_ZOONE|nr:hypothetical protein L798_04501 [Zootermopsis nevadensis]